MFVFNIGLRCITNHIRTGKSDSLFVYSIDIRYCKQTNYLIYLSLYDLLYFWCLYWKQTKLSDLPVLIWFVILLMSILKTNKTIWFTCPYMICYTSDVYTENKQNYLIYLSLYDLLYIWCLCITNHIRTGKSDSFVCFQYRHQKYNKSYKDR